MKKTACEKMGKQVRKQKKREDNRKSAHYAGAIPEYLPGSVRAHDLDGRFLLVNDENYRLIAQHTIDVIYKVNIEQDAFVYMSPSVERVFGYTPEECIGTTVHALLTDASYELQREKMRADLESGYKDSEVLELEACHKDGHIVPIEAHARFLFDDQGKPVEILGVTREISERKQAEEERAKLQLELAQAQKMESIGRLAGGLAHDFNNMLGVIIGRSEMALKRATADPLLFSDLQSILKVARHSATLIRQLMTFARKQTISPKVLDLNETLAKMLNMFQQLIGGDIVLDWRPGKGLWLLKMDPSQIDQILANLCVNARDAIENVGRITVETENVHIDTGTHAGVAPGQYVLMTFSDTGCGMDRTIIDRIFEPFFTTKEVGKGTGLGLSTIYGIVKQNQGVINVSSELGAGTTFRIYLPRFQGAEDRISQEKPLQFVDCGSETILVVEDEPDILEMTVMTLERLGYTVLSAKTPEEAIRLVEESPDEIQMLLTDVIMPGMNGWDLSKELLLRRPALKCLFMSGYDSKGLSPETGLNPKSDFIRKPFTLKNLAAKVRGVLDR